MRNTIPARIVVVVAAALAASACSADDTAATSTSVTEASGSTTTTAGPTTAGPTTTSAQGQRALSAPGGYDDVGPDYAAARAAKLAVGREAVEALLAGDTAALYAGFGDELKAAVSEDAIQSIAHETTTDRVHFEEPETTAIFDGRLTDGTISGSFTTLAAGIARPFFLEASTNRQPGAPLVGQWEGVVLFDETQPPTAFTVTFATEGGELTATIDAPDEELIGQSLTNVRYEPSREIGELLGESLLLGPAGSVYRTQHAWGPWTLVTTLGLDDDGTITSLLLPFGRPLLTADPATSVTGETEFRLPFDGVWWVISGGPTEVQNHHVVVPHQRYGYDLVVWKQGGTHQGDGTRNEDYWAWEEPVLAPADGTVVAVLDGLEDNTPGVLKPEPHPAGNHVAIQTGVAEYLFIAHFQEDSIQVAVGDEVRAGDLLGLTGNSGNSSEPHIHIHLHDEEDFASPTAVGLPLPFTGYEADGELVSVDSPLQGQLIQHADR